MNCPEYFMKGGGNTGVYPFEDISDANISRIFLVRQRYSFLIYSFIPFCLMVTASNILKYL